MPRLTPLFIERMEHILDLYAKPYDVREPVICFDEKSKQLIGDTRIVQKTKEGTPRRRDYEYKRHGTRNIFVTVEPRGGYRTVRVTARRKKRDFAKEIRRIVGLRRYRNVTTLHIVLDNLNTHFEKSLVETFEKEKAESLCSKIQFRYTPCHASWLNMAEIEIGILDRQCIRGRIPTEEKLIARIKAWQTGRNRAKAMIAWRFTVDQARKKFKYANDPRELC